jgi:hypothetical protein
MTIVNDNQVEQSYMITDNEGADVPLSLSLCCSATPRLCAVPQLQHEMPLGRKSNKNNITDGYRWTEHRVMALQSALIAAGIKDMVSEVQKRITRYVAPVRMLRCIRCKMGSTTNM